jgi:methyl-accepting chemotaxis protein
MSFSSIKFKLISAFFVIGLLLFLFMIIVVPVRTKDTAEKVMYENVGFIVKLLSDNLAIGMQTRVLDEGAALQQTLDLLKGDAIVSVAVLDPSRTFIKGINTDHAYLVRDTVVNMGTVLRVFRAMKDSDGKVQGYVEIAFSKNSFVQSINRFKVFIWIAGLITLGAMIVAGWLLANSIILPLNRSIEMLRDIASGEGDLTKRLALLSKDEVGTQAHWMNVFIDKLQAMVQEIKNNGDELRAVSERLTSVSSETSDAAQNMKGKAENSFRMMQTLSTALDNVKQASKDTSGAVKSIASAIAEMSVTMNDVARNCQKESEIAKKADAMATGAKDKMHTLEEVTKQIGKITKLIQDIADKTNLVALNAAIQAASAGEAGREFAVVAKEVKELAKQTSRATDEINTQIQSIVTTVGLSVEEINGIAAIINEVNTISQTISVTVDEQSSTATEISRNINATSTSAEQAMQICEGNTKVISQVASNIAEVNTAADKTEDGVKKNRESIENMTQTIDKTQQLVGRFRI